MTKLATCPHCKKKFRKVGDKRRNTFCSKECFVESKRHYRVCPECLKLFLCTGNKNGNKYCSRECFAKNKTREMPSKERLEHLIKRHSLKEIGDVFGVRSNMVRLWCNRLNVENPRSGSGNKESYWIKIDIVDRTIIKTMKLLTKKNPFFQCTAKDIAGYGGLVYPRDRKLNSTRINKLIKADLIEIPNPDEPIQRRRYRLNTGDNIQYRFERLKKGLAMYTKDGKELMLV